MQTIQHYEIHDLGIQQGQYFQGFGCAFTDFDQAVVGSGDTDNEALDDALETMAQIHDIAPQALDDIRDGERYNDTTNA